jgi:hypothetical protein
MIKKAFICLIVLLCCSRLVLGDVVSYRDNHLENNALSARGFAMGGAVTAVMNSIDNILYNSASLTQTNKYQFFLKSDQSLADVNQLSFLSVIPLDEKNNFGFGFIKVSVDDIPVGIDTGTSIEIEIGRASCRERVSLEV